MRPLRLRMQAFGPYADRQEVDFATALNVGLFGIYGPTGSGKTSIFGAIFFALFGKPVRSEQEASTLRSDHAKPDCLTEVELIFELGARRYLVRRRPEQMRPALRGGGETKLLHCAWLFDVTGVDVGEIADENPGKIIAERKTKEVTDEIERLLGYGPEEFRQIVLLPQGRFETFLLANTNSRLEILRELFDVTLYKRLTHKLKDDAKAVEEKIRADRQVCQARLEQEGFETVEHLSEGLELAKEEQQQAAASAKDAQSKAKLAEQQLAAANQVENGFSEHDSAVRDLNSLLAKSKEIERDKGTLAGAQAASSLLDVDRNAQHAKNAALNAEKRLSNANSAHAGAQKAAKDAADGLVAETARREETESLRERRNLLKGHRAVLEQAEQKKRDRDYAAAAERSVAGVLVQVRANRDALIDDRDRALQALKVADETAARRNLLGTSLQDAQQKLKAAQDYDRAVRAISGARKDVEAARDQHESTRQALGLAQTRFDNAEAALTSSQVLHLAQKLRSGEPCPVCGSSEHPAVAQGSAEGAGRNDAFQRAREGLEQARNSEGEAGRRLAGAQATFAERETALEKLSKPDEQLEVLDRRVAELDQALQALGAAADISAMKTTLESIEERIQKANGEVEEARTISEEAKTALAVATQALASALAAVPEEYRDRAALEAAIEALQGKIKEREDALDVAAKAERAANDSLIACAKEAESAAGNHQDALAESERATAELTSRLVANGLSEEVYEVHKGNIGRIDDLQSKIVDHGQKLAAANDRVGRAVKAIEGLTRPDIDLVRINCEDAAAHADREMQNSAAASARAESLERVRESVTAKLLAIEKAEEEYASLGEIAALFSGNNSAKVELEAFALAAMFDLVLLAANRRLKPMTSGQFTLQRDSEGGRGGARRGLGIAVHDVHTGSSRSTATLSGGETFMAALSLALGLSDVVSSVNGGVRLDTIFVDEGFGTLDTETLDHALQTLQDAGASRAVGLISHVETVQQAIPYGFQITKTPTGSFVHQKAA